MNWNVHEPIIYKNSCLFIIWDKALGEYLLVSMRVGRNIALANSESIDEIYNFICDTFDKSRA